MVVENNVPNGRVNIPNYTINGKYTLHIPNLDGGFQDFSGFNWNLAENDPI